METIKYTGRALQGMASLIANFTRVIIFKGTMPNQAEIATNNVAYYTTTRASDILLDIPLAAGSYVFSNKLVSYNDTVNTVASGAGTATWCALVGNVSYAMVGDITLLTGSGFLKLPDLNIVSGNSYRVIGMRFSFPYNFSY